MAHPRFLHVLTAIHAVGCVATLVMAIGSALSRAFRHSLAVSEGSALMVEMFGAWTSPFLLGISAFLASLAYASWKRRRRAWPMTLGAYSIGVLGSLWQVSVGIEAGWLSATINGAVVVYAARPAVARAYGWSRTARARPPWTWGRT